MLAPVPGNIHNCSTRSLTSKEAVFSGVSSGAALLAVQWSDQVPRLAIHTTWNKVQLPAGTAWQTCIESAAVPKCVFYMVKQPKPRHRQGGNMLRRRVLILLCFALLAKAT